MISFNYPLMVLLCHELRQRILNFSVVNCTPNDPQRFYLIFKKGTKSENLFFCFSPPFIRFHLTYISVKSQSSHHPLNRFLNGAVLKEVSLLNQDRILQLTFNTPLGELLFISEFFSKHPNYYLIDSGGKILHTLYPISSSHYSPPKKPFDLTMDPPIWTSHQEVEKAYNDLEKAWEINRQKESLLSLLNKKFKKLKKKEVALTDRLQQCERWPLVQHEGELIKFYYSSIKKGTISLTVQDWLSNQPYELVFDPSKSIQEEMSARFKQAKKLHAGLIPLSEELKITQESLKQLQGEQEQITASKTLEELSLPIQKYHPQRKSKDPSLVSKTASTLIYKEYHSVNGIKIWVGKNAKANDHLTFQLANGRDWWLHVRGYSGSHVIIRLNHEEAPDRETLNDALQLALYYSKARNQKEAEICFTQRKFVSKLNKKKSGLVHISKHQTSWVHFDPIRFKNLQKRSFRDSPTPHL